MLIVAAKKLPAPSKLHTLEQLGKATMTRGGDVYQTFNHHYSLISGLEAEEDASAKTAKKDKPVKKKIAENVQPVQKAAPAPVPKRQLQESDMFMAAFDDTPKKVPPAKKLKINKVVKVVQPDVPDGGDATSPVVKSEFDVSFLFKRYSATIFYNINLIQLIFRSNPRRAPPSPSQKRLLSRFQ
jgi:hypothetical protein